MASTTSAQGTPNGPKLDRYVVIHIATTCDEHGVYVTKDSAEVIEIGWVLLDSKTCDEVWTPPQSPLPPDTHRSSAAQRKHLSQACQHPNHTPLQ